MPAERIVLSKLLAVMAERHHQCRFLPVYAVRSSAGHYQRVAQMTSAAFLESVDQNFRHECRSEPKETHVEGFQRYGVFVARRFKPAFRICGRRHLG